MKDQKPVVGQKTEVPEVLGQYGGERITLSQDQMLGVGGGARYYEIESLNPDGSFKTVVHIAMPALLKHRPLVKAALRRHAQNQMAVTRLIQGSFNFDESPEAGEVESVETQMETMTEKLEGLEKDDIDALLEAAYYCFCRTDIALKGKSLEEAKEILAGWLDEGQLKRIPETAMGINKLERPPAGAV